MFRLLLPPSSNEDNAQNNNNNNNNNKTHSLCLFSMKPMVASFTPISCFIALALCWPAQPMQMKWAFPLNLMAHFSCCAAQGQHPPHPVKRCTTTGLPSEGSVASSPGLPALSRTRNLPTGGARCIDRKMRWPEQSYEILVCKLSSEGPNESG